MSVRRSVGPVLGGAGRVAAAVPVRNRTAPGSRWLQGVLIGKTRSFGCISVDLDISICVDQESFTRGT
jgi:hypothetical protein